MAILNPFDALGQDNLSAKCRVLSKQMLAALRMIEVSPKQHGDKSITMAHQSKRVADEF
mgnify:CR=1 FL=1